MGLTVVRLHIVHIYTLVQSRSSTLQRRTDYSLQDSRKENLRSNGGETEVQWWTIKTNIPNVKVELHFQAQETDQLDCAPADEASGFYWQLIIESCASSEGCWKLGFCFLLPYAGCDQPPRKEFPRSIYFVRK